MGKQGVLAWEKRWAVPAAVATVLAVVLLIASTVASQSISGDGAAEVARSIEDHKGSITLSGILQALGSLLLIAPVYYLFRAARARSSRVRPQLVGLIFVGPLFLAVAAGLSIGARHDGADQFVAGEAKSTLSPSEAKEKCETDLEDEGAKEFREEFEPRKGESPMAACERRKIEDEEAENALREASGAAISNGLLLAGGLAFLVAFIYTNLWAMRTGLLTRFWGSLGMASSIAFLIPPLFIVTLVFLIYLAFLLFGKVPGGKPPAWEAGEAIPWPTPGEKAAAELEPSEVEAQPESEEGGEKRKRKQRDQA